MNKIVVLSDIHANLTALRSVLVDISMKYQPDGFVFLGDIINYGMRPNEVIGLLKELEYPIYINLMGNHERAFISNDLESFSTERGKMILKYTSSVLTSDSISYIKTSLNPDGLESIEIGGKKLLFLHGNIDDPYWGKLQLFDTQDKRYSNYDYVFSGHTHLPHCIETFFHVDNPSMRNKKKTVFINPGSVGQPRNHNPHSQYAYVDINQGVVHLNAVPYDIESEQRLYSDIIAPFYKDRILIGI